MPDHPPKDIHDLRLQLSSLLEKASAGAAGAAIVAGLQAALETLNAVTTHDDLTDALNRRGLVQKLDAELDRAKRTGHPFSFAVIAVDQFHALNQQHGSAAGNEILKNLAQAILRLIRSLDSFGRIGDNEFALIMPTTWLDQSDKAIVRLSKALAAVDWDAIAPALSVTFSSGLTTNDAGDTAEQMIRRASEALAKAKAQGPGSSMQLEPALPDFDPEML